MQDFDADRAARVAHDRTFRMCGQKMTYRASVPPEVLAPWEDWDPATQKAGEGIRLMDDCIEQMLEAESVSTWRQIRQDRDDTPTAIDMANVLTWLSERIAGVPLDGGVPSLDSPAPTTPTSMVSSSLLMGAG